VTLLQGDLLTPLTNKVDVSKVDIIAANLPYIDSDAYADLAPDVREYEPSLALMAGSEGLDVITRLLEQAPKYLTASGVIFLEIGSNQGDAVLSLASAFIPQARSIELRQDYNGRDRIVTIVL
jgi:release factor glutamine methyltransferase